MTGEDYTVILPNNKLITQSVRTLLTKEEIEEELIWEFEQDSIRKTEKYP